MAERLLSGWGRSTWSRASVIAPHTIEDVVAAIGDAGASAAPSMGSAGVIARGLGRSYGDQATRAGGSVLDMTGLGDPQHVTPPADGVVTLPAGMSLHHLLLEVVPQGWFVPVSPGTRHVTIGGAIAADIHGKNHHVDGSFCDHVRDVTLALADGSVVTAGPESNAELFWATAGGFGLTGVVLAATVQLSPIDSSRVLVDTTRHADLDNLMPAMMEADRSTKYSVAWIDLAGSRAGGRSVLTAGRFATRAELSGRAADNPLAYDPSQRLATPSWIPNGLLRPASVKAFNEAWFRAAPKHREGEVQSIARFFHPLDGVRGWNRMYGSQGFLQWQMVVPDGADDVLRQCVRELGASPAPCFLAVLKRFGDANPGPLSFPMKGWTLAADMPALAPGLPQLLDRLDVAVAEAGGRIYLAKDARLHPSLLGPMYPRLDEWRAVRNRVDPNRVFRSDMSERLGL